MPNKKKDPDVADEGAAVKPAARRHAVDPRIAGAYFSGGVWYGADSVPLTNPEAQQAHRAKDRELAEQRRLALLGR